MHVFLLVPTAASVVSPAAGGPAAKQNKHRAVAVAAAAAAAVAFPATSPGEEAYRAGLASGGYRCFPVHCNGTPGLLLLPPEPHAAMQVGSWVWVGIRLG